MNERVKALIRFFLNEAEIRLGWNEKQVVSALLASITIFIVLCVGTGLIFQTSASISFTPTSPAILPLLSAISVTARLQQLGVVFTRIESAPIPFADWTAPEVVQGFLSETGTSPVLLLSYSSAGQAALDAFRAMGKAGFDPFTLMQVSNLIIVFPKGMPVSTKSMLQSHLTQLFIAPYRDFFPTATPDS